MAANGPVRGNAPEKNPTRARFPVRSRDNDVVVTIEGTANDGEAGENDFVQTDVESLVGGFGDDVFIGSSAANGFSGGAGDDALVGATGNDTLNGGFGDDDLNGQAGDDTFSGSHGADVIDGGIQNDTIDGGSGLDRIDAGTGLDDVTGGELVSTTASAFSPESAPFAAPSAPALAPAAAISVTVRCRSTRRRGGGITCRLSFAGGAPGAITAKLVRGGRNYAVAHKRVNGKRTRIKLRQVRRAKRGAYKLKLRDANSRTIASVKVSLR